MKKSTVIRKAAAILAGVVYCSVCPAEPKEGEMKITVVSPAFEDMTTIPSTYTCDGADISPPLAWEGIPKEAQSIVLICDDPDAPAGTWVHWVCYDIPPSAGGLNENIPAADALPSGGKQGISDFGRIGYGGPCPPSGTHRYFFKVYALDTTFNLPAGQTKKQIEKAMRGHVIASGELVGVYARRR